MAIVVQKYGGSSVADLERLSQVAELVTRTRRAGHDVVVVVSAMGKTTENLLSLAREAARRGDAGAEPARRELDMLVSTGERVSMALLSIAVQARGLDAISFTGSQSGIITNDRHFDARIIEVRPHRIEDELARGRIVIVAGYQGMSYRREITTLGRGGSDTTAVALAAALGAERCEIYSDVDGVYSADPKNVPDARHLPAIDYLTMQEMAESGAKVLNAQAVEWASRSKIVIHARKTADFAGGGGRETQVRDAVPDARVRAVVVDRRMALVSAHARAAEQLLPALARAELPVRDLSLDRERVRVSLRLTSVPDFERCKAELLAVGIEDLRVTDELTSISAVGVELGGSGAELGRALAALGGAPILTVSSPLRITSLVPNAELGRAEQAFHELFVANG